MEIFTQPKVYLISQPMINWSGVLEFFEDQDNFKQPGSVNKSCWTDNEISATASPTDDADLLPEFCGRMCYGSFAHKQGRKSNKDYLKHIIEMGHGSVLEHSNFTFLVTQCSRGFTHEMVRHRAGFAYSQESTHYIDYSIEKGKVVFDPIAVQAENISEIMTDIAKASLGIYERIYADLRNSGISKKDACSMARQILPNGIEAKLAFTGNIRALRHFMTMRGTTHNVLEIRLIAIEVFRILEDICPNSLYGLSLKSNTDGYQEIIALSGLEKI